MPPVPQKKQAAVPNALVPYYKSECGRVVVYRGDCREVMRLLEAESIHAVVSDPPYGLEFMGKDWDAPWKANGSTDARQRRAVEMGEENKRRYIASSVTYGIGTEFQQWFQTCAAEMLRVCKPGAHCLTFGGTRMFHRMTCAVEDAGFELRDVVMWVYGSGFPKSHDVSKAIDRMYGADREVVGTKQAGMGSGKTFGMLQSEGFNDQANHNVDVTAPATEDALRWQGWGTALKPSYEPCVLARKPLGKSAIEVFQIIEYLMVKNGLGGIQWKNFAKPVAKPKQKLNSTPTKPQSVEAIFVENAKRSVMLCTETVTEKKSESLAKSFTEITKKDQSNTLNFTETNYDQKSLPHTEENTRAAAKRNTSFLLLTTLTEEEENTGKLLDHTSIAICENEGFQMDFVSCAGTVIALLDVTDTALIVRVMNKLWKIQRDNNFYNWPQNLPKVIPAQSFTVAQNVLEHGTGGINIDGCRVGTDGGCKHVEGTGGFDAGTVNALGGHLNSTRRPSAVGLGRWPANLLHDGSDEVVRLFPETGPSSKGLIGDMAPSAIYGGGSGLQCPASVRGHDDDGGSAARFFYTAKANGTDRDDNHHPTVKPTDLMQYLVRLVAVKESLVMDPFMGSGSTGVACIREGMRFIGIEQSEEYCDIAVGRLKHELVQCGYAKAAAPPSVKVLKVGGKK